MIITHKKISQQPALMLLNTLVLYQKILNISCAFGITIEHLRLQKRVKAGEAVYQVTASGHPQSAVG